MGKNKVKYATCSNFVSVDSLMPNGLTYEIALFRGSPELHLKPGKNRYLSTAANRSWRDYTTTLDVLELC